MLVHTVLFWLKEDNSESQRAAFREGLESLRGISAVDTLYVGTPAATPVRPVIDTSYSFMLTVILRDLAAQDAYQEDPIHLAFVEKFKSFWDKVVIYDAD
jgi:hypothetical protein